MRENKSHGNAGLHNQDTAGENNHHSKAGLDEHSLKMPGILANDRAQFTPPPPPPPSYAPDSWHALWQAGR